MKNITLQAQKLHDELKDDLIKLSDLYYNASSRDRVNIYFPIKALLALSTLAENKNHFKFEAPTEIDSSNNYPAKKIIKLFLEQKTNDVPQVKALYAKIKERLKTDIISYLNEEKEDQNVSLAIFKEYPPCAAIFTKLYYQSREKIFFRSTGFWSSFIYSGENQEMHLRLASSESMTWEKILNYGLKYPKTRTAAILREHFPTPWHEARLKYNLNQKSTVLDGHIPVKDLQMIVRNYIR